MEWIPAIAMCIVIFRFSSQPAVESSATSGFFTRAVMKVFEMVAGLSSDQAIWQRIADVVEIIIRKSAHATEFALLYICILYALKEKKDRVLAWVGTAFAMTVLYACSDEFHQLFVPGRAGRVTDVLIDASGAFLISIILYIVKRKEQKQE